MFVKWGAVFLYRANVRGPARRGACAVLALR